MAAALGAIGVAPRQAPESGVSSGEVVYTRMRGYALPAGPIQSYTPMDDSNIVYVTERAIEDALDRQFGKELPYVAHGCVTFDDLRRARAVQAKIDAARQHGGIVWLSDAMDDPREPQEGA